MINSIAMALECTSKEEPLMKVSASYSRSNQTWEIPEKDHQLTARTTLGLLNNEIIFVEQLCSPYLSIAL